MTQPITYHSRAGLLALLPAPAVDRWVERFDAAEGVELWLSNWPSNGCPAGARGGFELTATLTATWADDSNRQWTDGRRNSPYQIA